MDGASLSGYVTTSFVIGGFVGNVIQRYFHRREKTRDVLQGLVWAVGGKPQDELGPAVPGLVQMQKQMLEQLGGLQRWADAHDAEHRRLLTPPRGNVRP